MRIYKLETNLTDKQNRELLKNLSEEDANFLAALDMKTSVDLLNEDDEITTVMVCNLISLEKLKTFLVKNEITFDIEDITEEFTQETDDEKLIEILEEITTEDILTKFGIEI
jgi:hypothetical protein